MPAPRKLRITLWARHQKTGHVKAEPGPGLVIRSKPKGHALQGTSPWAKKRTGKRKKVN